jgi:hypothetical protein
MDEDFSFVPPGDSSNDRGFNIPISAEAAWILELIDIKLNKANISEDIKNEFISDISPYVVNASMTQMSRSEVLLFLNIFEELWLDFIIFKCQKRTSPHLDYVHTLIKGYLMQQYNKSIEGWQGNHVFEKKHSYDVRQTSERIDQNDRGGWFRNRKKPKGPPVEYVDYEG